jgi:hypothetical protein
MTKTLQSATSFAIVPIVPEGDEDKVMQFKQPVYAKVGKDELGIIPSADGPKLIINREMFPLSERCWDLEMVIGRSCQLCTFYWQGEVKLSVRFEKEHDFFLQLYSCLVDRVEYSLPA